jgi:hydrogenase maturation protease
MAQVVILGVGSILMTDEGFGVRVVEALDRDYTFDSNVSVLDGGVLGINLMGVISEAEHLVVIDAVRNRGNPGDLYRLTGNAISERIRAKNSLHQIDLLETLALCQALETMPDTVILGVEPEDIDTMGVELTATIRDRIKPVIEMVLQEMDRLGIDYGRRTDHQA